MKRKILTLILLAVFVFTSIPVYGAEEKTYLDVFNKDKVIDVNIEIDEDDLQDMYDNAMNEEYHIADITIDGTKVENVGVRTKGNMTLRSVANSDSDRYSLRVKFDKYVKKQTFLGLDELCLNNGYSDPSYMREYLHYEILKEMGMKASNTVFCNVYINGELSGLYLAVESLEDAFLEREFGENYEDGNLYKMDEGSTLEYREDETYSYADLKVGQDKDYTEFKEFVKKLNAVQDGEKGDIESFLDVESALKYIAANTVMCSYDSYNGNMHHNFYLYETPEGIFTVLPWDYNMSFGGLGGNNSEVGIDTPYVTGSLETLPLIGKLLSIDEYKEQYYGYIKDIMALLENFEDRVNEVKTMIKPSVEKDPTAFYTVEEFEKATTSILNCVKDRLANLEEQFAGTADKVTTAAENRGNGGFGGGERPDGGNMPQPPEGMQMPDFNGQMPDFEGMGKGERPEPPEGFDPQKMGAMGDKNSTPKTIRVHVQGHIVKFDNEPVLKSGTTLVCAEELFEAVGMDITWSDDKKTVTAVKDDLTVELTAGSKEAVVNGEKLQLSAAPESADGNMMVPVRFIAEQLGMKVEWDGSTKLVEVTLKK